MELLLDYKCEKFNIKKCIPYLLLFVVSLVGCLVSFYDGYPIGDDTNFHFANIYDIYTQLKEGGLSPISGYLASGYGVGKQLFYSPIAHLIPALLGVILEPFGVTLLGAFKISLFISVFMSSIFMYRFSMHISKGRYAISFLVGAFFALYPYRFFDAYCRIAYAEALAFWFMPLFFMGIYDLCHMKELNSKPFLEIILGGALLFLTHNLTAFYAFVFAIIYILFHIVNIYKNIKKNKMFILYSVISVIIMVGFMSVTMFQSLELMSKDYYNISVPERMWSNVEAVISRNLDAGNYSGFLNFPFLSGLGTTEATTTSLLFDLLFFVLASVIFVIVDVLLHRFKYIHLLSAVVVYSVLIFFLVSRIEVYMASVAFMVMYLVKDVFKYKENYETKIYQNLNFWATLILLVLVIYLIARQDLWKILPKIFLNIQFPWRLWAFVPMFLCILLSEISNYFNNKIYFSILSISCGLLIVFNMSYIEKRIAYDRNYESNDINSWCYEINDVYKTRGMSIGANLEYLPQIYYYNSDYKSKYANSLFSGIVYEVSWEIGKHPYKYNPVILEGKGNIEVLNKKAPIYEMNIKVTEDTLIQMPLFYYDGYEIEVKNLDNNETFNIDVLDVDSLISFELDEGNYFVKTKYVGTKVRKIAKSYQMASYYLLFIFLLADMAYGLYVYRKKLRA